MGKDALREATEGIRHSVPKRMLPPAQGDMITGHESTAVGPDGFVKKEETKDASSVEDMLVANRDEQGFIHITYTVPGATVGWSSARPVTSLSRFLAALGSEPGSLERSGDDSSDSSDKELKDILQSLNVQLDILNANTLAFRHQ